MRSNLVRRRIREYVLIWVYNLALILQVIVFAIPVGNVLLMFWVENLFLGVGAYFSLRRARANADTEHEEYVWKGQNGSVNQAQRPYSWIFSYGFFTAIHFCFVFALAFMTGWELSLAALWLPVALLIGTLTLKYIAPLQMEKEEISLFDRENVADTVTRMIVAHLVILAGWGLIIILIVANNAINLGHFSPAFEHLATHLHLNSTQFVSIAVLTILAIGKAGGESYSTARARRRLAFAQAPES